MKITLAQQNYHIGNLAYNESKIVEGIEYAKLCGSDLVVFSELAVCGYPPQDLILFDAFIDECHKALMRIATHAKGIAVLVGVPRFNPSETGKRLLNSACFIQDGEIVSYIDKTRLPNYDIFDESRYFEPAKQWQIVNVKGIKMGVTICEDIWDDIGGRVYETDPLSNISSFQPDFIINLSASPFDYTHQYKRNETIRKVSQKYGCAVMYCNSIGAHTNILFDGDSRAFGKDGSLVGSLPSFEEGYLNVTMDEKGNLSSDVTDNDIQKNNFSLHGFQPAWNIDLIHKALITGIKDYFGKMGFSKAILGSSGGIDSAVVLALAVEALGKDNVISLMMPSAYSSEHSVADAKQLSENLGNENHLVPILDIHNAFTSTLDFQFRNTQPGLAEENIQSRIRGNLLMAMANKRGAVLLNTSNKSELATGYGTLYGDMAGGISVLGDCYKLQVYELAKHINRNEKIIPVNILTKAPSAELRPDQKDTDSLPEYDVLDPILFHYIERQISPSEIKNHIDAPEWIDKIIRMVNANEYKRHQFCPILRISPKSLGSGRKMPIVAKFPS